MSTFARGDLGRLVKQFTVNGTTPVVITDSAWNINTVMHPTVRVVGGTIGAIQIVPSAGGFTVTSTAGNTSTYNYIIFS